MEVIFMAVHEQYRRGRYGQRLATKIKADAKAMDCVGIYLCAHGNVPQTFWKKMGYAHHGECPYRSFLASQPDATTMFVDLRCPRRT